MYMNLYKQPEWSNLTGWQLEVRMASWFIQHDKGWYHFGMNISLLLYLPIPNGSYKNSLPFQVIWSLCKSHSHPLMQQIYPTSDIKNVITVEWSVLNNFHLPITAIFWLPIWCFTIYCKLISTQQPVLCFLKDVYCREVAQYYLGRPLQNNSVLFGLHHENIPI